jgi:hypothetical protein
MPQIEKRREARLSPKNTMFAGLGKNYARVGKVNNLSLGGLAFEYIDGEDMDQTFSQISQIDIFVVGGVFHLYGIPCEVKYDIKFDRQNEDIENSTISSTRRCGVQFGKISKDDLVQLKSFLKYHTNGSEF